MKFRALLTTAILKITHELIAHYSSPCKLHPVLLISFYGKRRTVALPVFSEDAVGLRYASSV